MPIVKCKVCSSEFYAKPSWLKRGDGKFCSAKCHHFSNRNGKVVSCFICNKEVYKPLKALNSSKSGKYFCTKSCQTKWRNTEFVGPKHANWKGGFASYRAILIKNKAPKICKICKTKDQRVLAVHHVDHNRQNNNLKNLVWLCHNCHFLVHHDSVVKKKFMEVLV